MEKVEYELKIIYDENGLCRCQYVHETEQLIKYPFDMDNPFNMIYNLGNKCQLFIVSNEKVSLDDLYLLTDMKTIDHAVCAASSERLVEIVNGYPLGQKKIIMTTHKHFGDHPKIKYVENYALKVLIELYKNEDFDINEYVEFFNK
jgi:hypothetical protein